MFGISTIRTIPIVNGKTVKSIAAGLVLGVAAIGMAVVGVASAAHAATVTVTVDFDAIDTSGGQVSGAPLNAYLAGFGITLGNVTSTATVSAKKLPGDPLVLTSAPNYLSQWWNGINGTSFDLNFGTPLDSLMVTIPEILSGVLVPAWSLTALDTLGNPLGSYSQGLAGSPFPARTFTFTGPNIGALRVFSNVGSMAGMGGIPIDDLKLTSTIPEPAALAIFGLGLAGLGFARRRRMI